MPFSPTATAEFPFIPVADGAPPVLRAVADANVTGLLQAAVTSGQTSPLLANMLSGSVPSMLNGLGGIPLPNLLSALDPTAATSDGVSQEGQSAPQWGIFDSGGNPVINPQSIVSVEWSGDYKVISYPIEKGNFETYNKVKQPAEVTVIMRQGGTPSDRSDFLTTLETIRTSLDLYTVTTPERSYANFNITRVDYPRHADLGAGLIQATIHLQEINVNASSTFSNVQQPDSQDTFNGGTVDATPPTNTQSAAATPVPF